MRGGGGIDGIVDCVCVCVCVHECMHVSALYYNIGCNKLIHLWINGGMDE